MRDKLTLPQRILPSVLLRLCMSRKGGEGGLFCCCCCFCVHARNKRLLSFLGKHQRCSRQHVLLSFLAFGMHSGEAAFLRKTRMQLSGPCDFVDPERNTKRRKQSMQLTTQQQQQQQPDLLLACFPKQPSSSFSSLFPHLFILILHRLCRFFSSPSPLCHCAFIFLGPSPSLPRFHLHSFFQH